MSAPSIKLQWPSRHLFNWPPDPLPIALPPPLEARTFASPFPIPSDTFNALLDWKVPVTIASVYATTAIFVNKVNRDRKNKPWGFSKTKSFYYFVLAHNIFLAVFSGLTFFGMIRALAHTWPGRRDLPFLGKLWPGMRTQYGLAGAADALCKLHGPRDLGDAVFYHPQEHAWYSANRLVKFGTNHTPDTSDVGRLWNEGLAFWGWWFYLSKFYEVLDTFIILAKGKRSSTLQTYHHAGAMACMWAGIRYMSPPIWMFVFINSFIHTLMYTYYTLSALRVRVPQGIKRTLTTMQITQFLVGITFAALHLFVHYSVPVATPYSISRSIGPAASVASSAASSAVSAAASKAPEVAAGLGATLQKILLRGAGEEGMAQKVTQPAHHHVPNLRNNATDVTRPDIKWRTTYEYVPCLDTDGQTFAIWLNLVYLAPLTVLFMRFFVRSYLRRGSAHNKPSKSSARISKAAGDAAHGVDREVNAVGKAAENGVGDVANNALNKIIGNESTKNQRRVSATIGRIANQFEKPEDEAASEASSVDSSIKGGSQGDSRTSSNSIKGKSSSESLRRGQIRKKASVEHNKLRQMFEEGPDALGRSVDSSPKPGTTKHNPGTESQSDNLSPCVEDDEAEKRETLRKLQNEAEKKIKGVLQAVGGQASKSVEDDDHDQASGNDQDEDNQSLEESKFSATDFSLVDVRDEDQKKKAEAGSSDGGERSSRQAEKKSKHSSNSDAASRPPTTPSRSRTKSRDSAHEPGTSAHSTSVPRLPAPSDGEGRSPSPKRPKSKIPQLTTKRSTSPTKRILTPATTTISVAAHSSPAIAGGANSEFGKADS